MKNLIYVLIVLLFVACSKEETVVPQPTPTPTDNFIPYTGEVASMQGNIIGYNFDVKAPNDSWQSYSMGEIISINDVRLPYFVYRTSLNKPFYDPKNVGNPIRMYAVNINFVGIDTTTHTFEYIKQLYQRGKKMPFKVGYYTAKEGMSIDFLDWDYVSKVVVGGSSSFGDQTGSTWEILDCEEIPVNEYAKRRKITNSLRITSLINCKLYGDKGYAGEVKNLKIQVVLNYRKM
ncbi:MAG: hypothetical protein ACOVQA_01070 [Thermoflexibacteraceae bacterium]|jgi:hypothetical protein